MHRATAGERVAGAYAWTVVLLRAGIVLGWIAAAVAAWVLLPALGGSSTAPLGDIVATEAQAIQAQQRALELFGSTAGTDTAVVQRNPRGLTRREVNAHVEVARPPRGVRAAVPVLNARVGEVRWPERDTTVVTYLFMGPELNLVERDRAARVAAARLERTPGTQTAITGAGPARLQQFEEIEDALPLVTAATLLVIVAIVALYFRSVGAPLLTLVTAAVAYVVAVRGLAWAGEHFGVTAPSEVEPVLVVLLLGLVTDYTVFFMADARRRLLRGEPRLPAARHATARIAPVVLTAGIVVAGGTASLLAGRTEFFRVFGPGLALCALAVTVVCVTFVPAVLGLAGPRLFGRRVRDARPPVDRPAGAIAARLDEGSGSARRNRWRLRMASALGGLRASRSQAQAEGGRVLPAVLARLMATRPVAVLLVLACVGALGFAASRASTADLGVSYLPSLPAQSEPRRAADDAARGFGPGVLAPVEVIVEQPGLGARPDRLVGLQALLAREEGVATVLGPREPAGTPLERQAIASGGGAVRFVLLLDREPTGAAAIDAFERLRDRTPALLREAGLRADARVLFGGETALAAESVDALQDDLLRVALAAFVVTFVLLAVFLRALVAAALLVLGSVLAFAASFGLATLLLPRALGGTDFVFYVPLVAGVLLVGLGSDYNVFIAGRIREELRRRRLREAIATAVPAASRAITVAGITLAATFALLALVPLRPFRELALLMTIGVLVDALVVRPLLIPTLLAAVGPRAWWPGRPQRPPRSRDFLARVKEHAGVERGIDAERITHATLATLAERIPAREAAEIAAQLPPSLGRALRADAPRREPFGADEFVERVASRSRTSVEVARGDARAVMVTLVEALPATEVDYVRAVLSVDYRVLLGDGPGVGRLREPVG